MPHTIWCKFHWAQCVKGNYNRMDPIPIGDRSPVNSRHKGQWREALMFSLICTWINVWINNHEAGDLRRHRSHYDVTVMKTVFTLIHGPVLPHQAKSHESNNVSDKYPTMHHFVTEMCTCVHTCAHFCYKMVHCGIWDKCTVGLTALMTSRDAFPWEQEPTSPSSGNTIFLDQNK